MIGYAYLYIKMYFYAESINFSVYQGFIEKRFTEEDGDTINTASLLL